VSVERLSLTRKIEAAKAHFDGVVTVGKRFWSARYKTPLMSVFEKSSPT
jgi:hypothetical protein